ncbi:MAG: FAD:protein FMN transferase [Gammaproteobacteria bacterium]
MTRLSTAAAALLLAVQPAHAAWHSDEAAIMGTGMRVELWLEDERAAKEAIDSGWREMHRIDRLMSTYKDDSEISAVNREAAQHPVEISAELFDLIEESLELSRLSNGAFDITYASVGYLYDYREHRKPSDEQIEAALPAIDYRHVKLDEEAGTVAFDAPGVRVDLGGIAKGYAVERCVDLLREQGVEHAIVTAGGDSRILGDRRGKPWIVGIRDPRERGRIVARLPLADEAISTSGDYERYFEEDGERYHHIISPATGRSVDTVRSATVIGPNATRTDGLSTAIFVLGPEKGLELIEGLPDVEAVIVDAQGHLHYSSGFEQPRPGQSPSE